MEATQLPVPKLKITFDGLLAVCHNQQQNHAEVGILSTVPRHQVTITVTKSAVPGLAPEPEPEPVFSATFSHPFIRLFETLELNVSNPGNPGISFRKAETPLNRHVADNADPAPDDFRWVIDLEGEEFHDAPMPSHNGHLKPILILKHGEFYTAEKVAQSVLRTRGGATETFGKIAESIGVDILLNTGSELTFKFGGNSQAPLSFTPEWRFALEPATDYSIKVENICPPGTLPPDQAGSDLKYYYTAFAIPEEEQFEISLPPVNPLDPDAPSAPDNLCENTFLGQTQTFQG